MSHTILDMEAGIRRVDAELAAEHQRHNGAVNNLQREKRALLERLGIMMAGLDLAKIERAKGLIEIRGTYTKAGDDRAKMRENAITELLKGGGNLRQRYIGTKSYAGFYGQGIECGYGYGPRHGSVIFAIELRKEYRERDLTADEIDDAIYYLRQLEAVEKATAD